MSLTERFGTHGFFSAGKTRFLLSALFLSASVFTACDRTETPTGQAASPTAALSPTPSPTPIPAVVLIAPSEIPGRSQELACEAVEEFASNRGWLLNRQQPGEELLGVALQENPVLIVTVGTGMGGQISAAAETWPGIRFVAVEETGVAPLPNLLVVGGDYVRQDEIAFLAGLLAGIENGNEYVGWVGEAGTVRGTIYRNGFRHGVHYICPYCHVFEYELSSTGDIGAGLAVADSLAGNYVDTASAVPGPAGEAALQELAERTVRVAGTRPDFYDSVFGAGTVSGAEYVLGGPAFRPDILLADVLPRFLEGESFSEPVSYCLSNGGIELDSFPNEWISIGRQNLLAEILQELASGRLDIGIDLQTGEEL